MSNALAVNKSWSIEPQYFTTAVAPGVQVEVREVSRDMAGQFINYLDASPKTIETYTIALRQFFTYLEQNLIRYPQREDVVDFREGLRAAGRKPTTIQNYITVVKLFFSWTALAGLYPNIAYHLKGAKLDHNFKKDYLTANQVNDVLEAIRPTKMNLTEARDFAIVALMSECGCRCIEIARAKVEDIRVHAGQTVFYYQGKGHEERTQYKVVPPEAERVIRAYLKLRGNYNDHDPLFISTSNNSNGKALTTRSISGIAKASLRKAGFNSPRLTAHSLRHTFVTLSIRGGEQLESVQEAAGHKDRNTTERYNHCIKAESNTCSKTVENQLDKDKFKWTEQVL